MACKKGFPKVLRGSLISSLSIDFDHIWVLGMLTRFGNPTGNILPPADTVTSFSVGYIYVYVYRS